MSEPMPMVWLDGVLIEGRHARVAPTDHGLTVGDGVFETLKVVGETPFALSRHLARLTRSAAAMGIAVPPEATLRQAADAVVGANPGATKLRITVASGPGPAGSGRGDGPPTVVVFADATPLPKGTIAVATVPWTRNEQGALAGLKTTSYAENVLALRHARAQGADEALFANTSDQLCEGTGTNVFVVLDDRLLTPPLAAGCLAGVTRELVLEVTDAVEEAVPMALVGDLTEMFVTSSTRDVQAVASVDGDRLPVVNGAVTQAAATAFARRALDLDP